MGSGRFEGKVALVTGAGRGVGRAVALLLAEEGASVVVNDTVCDGAADAVTAEIEAEGGAAVASYDDVSDMGGGERAVRTAIDRYERIDILVNSAGMLLKRPIQETTPEEFERLVRSNVKGAFVPTKFAAIQFRQQRSGRIVNMTSDAGLGSTGMSAYAAASEAVVGLTRTVARDLGKYGVTCNAVSPAGGQSRDGIENAAALAVLLCTEAAPNANGYVFGADGGRIYVYSNPEIERSIHKWGDYTMDDMDALAPGLFEGRS
jgi:NAD(P)-dependent dehydrogenase (short-subunit alcohol dehydrogenase family)